MIGKATSCPGGTALFVYVVNDKKGYELTRNGLSGLTPKELYSDMSILQQQNLRCTNNTISIVLSPAIKDSEGISDDKLKRLTEGFLMEMNLDPKLRQFIAFVHTEKNHKHVHILMNRVKTDGSLIKDNFISKNAQSAAHKIALEYGLISAKVVKETKERERKELKKEIRGIIKKAHYQVLRKKPKNLEAYQKEMAKFGIQVTPTINKQGNIQGYRFLHAASVTNLKASEVDRNIKLHQLFIRDHSLESKNLDKQQITKDYSINTSLFKSIISQLANNLGEYQNESFEQNENFERKKKINRRTLKR